MDVRRIQRRLADAGFYSGTIDGLVGRRTYGGMFAWMARKDLGAQGEGMGRGAASSFGPAALNTELRLAHFLSQTAAETGAYRTLEENLNYSAKRLTEVFPRYFPTIESTQGYAGNPQAIANRVYSNRLGNGPPESNDGWDFRGRGLIQLTGRANYAARAAETGLPLEDMPELAADPETGTRAACLFWTSRNINAAADADDVVAVRRLVNGGTHGLESARTHLRRAKALLL